MSSMAYLPLDMIGERKALKELLTVRNTNYYNKNEQVMDVTTVRCYDESKLGYLGVPRAFAAANYRHTRFVKLVPNVAKNNILSVMSDKIKPRDAQQAKFMQDLANVCNKDGLVDCIANAGTGSGKTVAALWLAAKLGRPTVIIVPRVHLLKQWVGSVEEKCGMAYFFGEDFVSKYVGIVQQGKCDYKGKLFVVAMAQSLASRNYGGDFYKYFGTLVIDEVHTTATEMLAAIFTQFPTRVRVGFTATNRKDSLRKVGDLHMGTPMVVSKQETLRPVVYVCRFKDTHQLWGNTEAQQLTSLAMYHTRNNALVKLIYTRGYVRQRNVVVFSDKVKQLQILQKLLIDRGIDEADIGLYVGQLYAKDNKGRFINKKVKVKDEEYERIKRDCPIILTTYGIFNMGIDIPRLDMGVEATPRTGLVQAVGRVVRSHPNKPVPEWYTISDLISYTQTFSDKRMPITKSYDFLVRKAASRLTSFRKHKADIKIVKGSL